jgi:hypothetical protein
MNRLVSFGVVAALVVGGASAVLAQETGSIPEDNYGSLITFLPTATAPDLAAFTDTSTVNCVKVSTLPEDATNNAAALDAAITANQQNLTTLQGSIQANAAFLAKVEQSCAVAEFDPTKILGVQTEADGSFKVWLDDRAMAGGAMGAETPAPASN